MSNKIKIPREDVYLKEYANAVQFLRTMLRVAGTTYSVTSNRGVVPYWDIDAEPFISEEFKTVLLYYTNSKAVVHACDLTLRNTTAEHILCAIEAILAVSTVYDFGNGALRVSLYPICKWEGYHVMRLHDCKFVPESLHLFTLK